MDLFLHPQINMSELRQKLYEASLTLSLAGLLHAAKWTAEALVGLGASDVPLKPATLALSAQDMLEEPQLVLARSLFACKEFDRAAYLLKNCNSPNANFLRLYSQYLSIDKKAVESRDGLLSTVIVNDSKENLEDTKVQNRILDGATGSMGSILAEAEEIQKNGEPNAFICYLIGVILNKRKNHSLARMLLVESVQLFPYNWSAWHELLHTFNNYDEALRFTELAILGSSELTSTVMFEIFQIVLLQEFDQRSANVGGKITSLLEKFPDFTFLKVQRFLVAYHSLDYFTAESIFDEILLADPMRLDDLDTYSNMLYVMEKKAKLLFLAHFASSIDKFRSETCCVVANYYSMRGEHDKSIMYYKRALTLNKDCLSAWTLMGHEFVELKNSHAAIESYRRAVDINEKDFRAWYGLGQAYEVLDMHIYALYYYQRATRLQPMDKRMWQATGNCYEKLNKWEESLRSFEKALAIDNINKSLVENGEAVSVAEPHICYKLATISEKLGGEDATYKYMRMCFELEMEWGITDETSKARLWLARDALKRKLYEEAYALAKDFNFSSAHDVEEARAVAKEARSRMTL